MKGGFIPQTEITTVQRIVDIVTEMVSGATEWVGSYLTVIEESELLMFFMVVGFVGLGVGLIKRLMRV